jgi:hypothetical protein
MEALATQEVETTTTCQGHNLQYWIRPFALAVEK